MMSRPTTATVDDQGYVRVKLPAGLRKKLGRGSKLRVHTNGDALTLTPALPEDSPKMLQRKAEFDRVFGPLEAWAKEKGITIKDVRRAVKQVRAEARAQRDSVQGRSR